MRALADSDEAYVLGLCDEILGRASTRQHRFDFLRGDPSPERPHGVALPVDAYYPDLALVIEYRELQHSEPNPHFDKPGVMTVSNCDRGKQRRIYDQRRRDVLPANGIQLIEIDIDMLSRGPHNKLRRDYSSDVAVLRALLGAPSEPAGA